MKFIDFQDVMSSTRMNRYLIASGGNSRKAMTLYRLNLHLTQELFTVVSCFEIALRNRIDQHYTAKFGNNWLKDSAVPGGIFSSYKCGKTPIIIGHTVRQLPSYTHPQLVAALDFGFWRYTFARHQYFEGGQTLLDIFPAKPKSSRQHKYDHNFIFSELEKINLFRNRLAHHEPVCFLPRHPIKDTTFARSHYKSILQLFQWMRIDEEALLYGLDHIPAVADKIDHL